MADFNGTIASMQKVVHPIIDLIAHPPVLKDLDFEAAGPALTAGEILALDANDYAVSYDPDSLGPEVNIVGVLAEDVDPSGEISDINGKVLWHGAVKASALTVGGDPATATDIASLEAAGRIFTV